MERLEKATNWKFHAILRARTEANKIEDFNTLLPIEEHATMPDLDQLDKLMRYQTSLQRQLSTTIGELLSLNKQ